MTQMLYFSICLALFKMFSSTFYNYLFNKLSHVLLDLFFGTLKILSIIFSNVCFKLIFGGLYKLN